MSLVETARAWADADPHDGDRAEIEALIEAENRVELERRVAGPLAFGTVGLGVRWLSMVPSAAARSTGEKLAHEEGLAAGKAAAGRLSDFLVEFTGRLP